MLTLPVVFADDADADIGAVEEWITVAAASVRTAERYSARLRARCLRIGLVPKGGALVVDFGADVRRVAFERSATIYYRVEPDRVLILRVLRRGRDVEGALTP